MSKPFDSLLRNGSRALFVALILFEIANVIRILDFTVVYTWFGLVITSLGIFIALESAQRWSERRTDRQLPGYVWLLALFAVIIDAAGDFFHWYRLSWYDQGAHFTGLFIATTILFVLFSHANRQGTDRSLRASEIFVAIGCAVIAGNIYEIEEYLEDLVSVSSRLGNGFDTANDLLMNLLGAVSAAAVLIISRARQKRYVRPPRIR